MSSLFNAMMGAAGTGAAGGGYSVSNSIVLDDGSSQYLTGPTLSGGSERIGTYSFWTKRANLGTQQEIYTQYRTSSSNLAFRVRFLSGDTLDIVCENDAGGVILKRTTTQVFRDPHAFLHVHIQIDGNQTDDTCCTLTINGSAVSDFSTKTNLSSGTDLNLFTSSKSAFIGSTPGPAGYYDGYLSEFVAIDGSNAAATSFGEYDTNGVWRPVDIANAGLTFGNNGFYLDFEVDGDSTLIDDAGNHTSFTFNGDATTKADQKKFGAKSLYVDGTGDYLSVADSADWQLGGGTGSWTIEGWFRFEAGVTSETLCGQTADGSNKWELRLNTSNIHFSVRSGGTLTIDCNGAHGMSTGTWYHVAAVRDGNDFEIFVDGSSVATLTDTDSIPDLAAPLGIGAGNITNDTNAPMQGWIDEFRISDTARYTTSFTPSTSAFETDVNTQLLLSFDRWTGLGADVSGNGNDFTTSGSPTQSSSTPTNIHCVVTPLYLDDGALSEGNLTITPSGPNGASFGSIVIPETGVWGAKVTNINGCTSTALRVGVCSIDADKTANLSTTSGIYGVFYRDNGVVLIDGSSDTTGLDTFAASSEAVEIIVDRANDLVHFYTDGGDQGEYTIPSGHEGKPLVFATNWGATDANVTWDFGQGGYDPSGTHSGALALNSANLYANAAPAIEDGTAHFQATDYTGDGSDGHEINQSGNSRFQPDLLWVKSRSAGSSHCLFDAVRGASERVFSNLTNAQATSTEYLATFDADGFTMNDNSPLGVGDTNADTTTYIGWQWKGDGTSGATNTDGTIPTTVNVNSTAGFSILKYTGNGTDGATIGHGLGAIPDMAFFKRTSDTSQWTVHHKGLTGGISGTYGLEMNTNGKQTITFGAGYADGFTSTVCALQDGSTNATNVNTSGSTYLGIFFTSIPGYSAFGSYEGGINSADGVLALLDFKPAFIMLKNIDNAAGENWFIWDNRRDGYNGANNYLLPNEANLEVTTEFLDIISNGFKIRINDRSVGGTTNTDTIIYAAFAEHPFAGSSPATAR